MTAGLRPLQPQPPEWRRSGRYFLIALAVHGAVLFYPRQLPGDQVEVPPPVVIVKLTESRPALPAMPPARPEAPAKPQPPRRENAAPTPRPILALAPEQATAPSVFPVAAPVPAPVAAPPAPATPVAPAAPAPTASAAPVSVSAARFDAAYLHNPRPTYPPLSRRLGEEGKVYLKVRVSAEGQPTAVDIEKSSNFERLDEAARQVVARWRFVPAKRGDEAVEATVIVPIAFRLDD